MSLQKWVDFSKWQGPVGTDKLARMKADGVAGIWPGAWHGIDANPYVKGTLRDAAALDMETGTYTIINNRAGAFSVRAAQMAVGDTAWLRLRFVAIDVELKFSEGVDGERIVRDAAAEIIRQGNRPVLYTGNWFWGWWMLMLGHAPDVGNLPVIIAYYNGRPDLDVPTRPGYGPIVGHQYTGSTSAYGTTVDFNVIDKAWLDAWPPAPSPEPDPPAPSPDEEEEFMGKIKEIMARAGAEIEAEIAQAKTLPVPIKGDTGATGPTGPAGKDAGGAAGRRTYTVVSGDTLSGIADKFEGVSWRQIYEANKAAIGADPDLIQPGMVLVIP